MRDVLIALCGLTPQVVTETLWALAQQRPPVVPEEVSIITTESGRKACERLLFGKAGKFASYLREFPSQRRIRCGPDSVITLKGADGRPIEDLRGQQDNLAVADQIAAVIRELTGRRNVRLHYSVAGGRKTMGVLLAGVLEIYGRPADRLYHVLVPPAFESHPDFFYIPKRPRLLATHEGRRLNTQEARIELAEIPYVRLRAFLSEELLKEPLPFSELVSRAQKELRAFEQPEPVRIDAAADRLIIGEATVHLTPAQVRLYTAFARIKTEHCVEPSRKTCGECISCYPVVCLAEWDAVQKRLEELAGEPLLSPTKGETVEGPARFRALLSKMNKKLVQRLGSARVAEGYQIRSVRESGATRYGLAVDKTLIRLES